MIEGLFLHRIDMNGAGIPVDKRVECPVLVHVRPAPAPGLRGQDARVRAGEALHVAVFQALLVIDPPGPLPE